MSGIKKNDLKLMPMDDLKKVVKGLVAVPSSKPKPTLSGPPAKRKPRAQSKARYPSRNRG
jgi:hypothetical protein